MLDGLFFDLGAKALELPLGVAIGDVVVLGTLGGGGHQLSPAESSTSPKRS